MVAIVALGDPHSTVVKTALETHGWEVVHAKTTREAIELFNAHHPNVGLVVVGGCVEAQTKADPAGIIAAVRNGGYGGPVAGVVCHPDQWIGLTQVGCGHVLSGDAYLLASNLPRLAREAVNRMWLQ